MLVWIAFVPSAVRASTITVNTTGDPGPIGSCDLRDAITNANNKDQSGSTNCVAGSGADTIVFSVGGTITLGSDLTPVANPSGSSLTIDGGGSITIDGSSSAVFIVNPGATLNLNWLTIANGRAPYGGGLKNLGTATVTNCTFSNNGATSGGGINNNAAGAALTVINSTFSNNGAVLYGGAIENAGTATVTNCTFSDNGANTGGGIDNSGTLTLTNSSFSDNSATSSGGAIFNFFKLTVRNSILASSTSGGNCAFECHSIVDGGYNISDDNTCGFTGTGANGKPIGDNVNDTNIALGPLANNGGFTDTFALETGSYAIDAIPITRCPTTDQRGAPRPDPGDIFHPACDIGAFESGNLVWIGPPSLNFGTVAVGQRSAPMTVMLNNQSGQDLKIRQWSIGANYAIVGTTCPPPPSILPSGDSCIFDIIFRPIYGGVRNELFQVNDNLAGGKQTVSLHGVATSSPPPR
jgi:predicted outer membrane repeat protein